MLALLLIALLFIVLFGGLGVAVSPLFFLLLIVVVLLALGGGFYGRGHS
ncbi:MAG: hypothetical protein ABIP58_09330 [Dehalococcoidia bacterium]